MSDALANLPPQFQGLIWYLGLIAGVMGAMLVLRWALGRIAAERRAAREQERDAALDRRLQAIETVQGEILERLRDLESRFDDRSPMSPDRRQAKDR